MHMDGSSDMRMAYDGAAPKRPINLSLNEDLIAKAKALGINISAAAEAGVAHVVAEAERRRIEAQAEAAMQAWNDYGTRHGSIADEFGEI